MPERKLIYADTVVEKLSELILLGDYEKQVINLFVDQCMAVDAEPVVHGRWIIEDADSGEHGCYEAYMIAECSHCGQSHEVETGQFGWVYGDPFPFNYCPNCGAKMDGECNG